MRISAVIVTKDKSALLRKCLDSLYRQTERPDEVIVVDNSSINDTKNTVFSFNNKLNVRYFLEKTPGISFARNVGVKRSRNEIIAFIDHDCIADKNWCKSIKRTFKKNKLVDAVASRTLCANPINIVTRAGQFLREYLMSSQYRTDNIFVQTKGYFITHSSTKSHLIFNSPTENLSLRKTVFRKTGLFDENMKPTGEDSEFSWRMGKHGVKILYEPKIVIYHHHRETLKGFLLQHFYYGFGIPKIKRKWPDFPSGMPDTPLNILFFLAGFLIMPLFKILQLRRLKDIISLPVIIIMNEFAYRFGIICGLFAKKIKHGRRSDYDG